MALIFSSSDTGRISLSHTPLCISADALIREAQFVSSAATGKLMIVCGTDYLSAEKTERNEFRSKFLPLVRSALHGLVSEITVNSQVAQKGCVAVRPVNAAGQWGINVIVPATDLGDTVNPSRSLGGFPRIGQSAPDSVLRGAALLLNGAFETTLRMLSLHVEYDGANWTPLPSLIAEAVMAVDAVQNGADLDQAFFRQCRWERPDDGLNADTCSSVELAMMGAMLKREVQTYIQAKKGYDRTLTTSKEAGSKDQAHTPQRPASGRSGVESMCHASADTWELREFPLRFQYPWRQYYGQLKRGLPHGEGFLVFKDGGYHVGVWADGQALGAGAHWYSSPRKLIQIGFWAQNKPEHVCFQSCPQTMRLNKFRDGKSYGVGVDSGHPFDFDIRKETAAVPSDLQAMTRDVFSAAQTVRTIAIQSQSGLSPEAEEFLAIFDAAMFALPYATLQVPGGFHERLLKDVMDCRYRPDSTEPLYELRQSESKGTGIFATASIHEYQCLLRESPLMACGHSTASEAKIAQLVSQLDANDAPRFWELHDCHHDTPTALGIFETNALFACGDAQGLFVTLSRVNHSCKPNCLVHWDQGAGKEVLLAVQKVAPGEELVISYLPDDDWPRKRRREYLARKFGFDCQCQLCAESNANDERLTEIAKLDDAILTWRCIPRVAYNAAYTRIQLLLQEGRSPVTLARTALDAYQLCYMANEEAEALGWLRVYARYKELSYGPESQDAQEAVALLSNPHDNQYALMARMRFRKPASECVVQ